MSPPTKPTTCIDDLPPEMIRAVFEHLHPKDLAACSMVNRRWHAIYANFKLHRLVVIDFDPVREVRKWYNSNQPILEAERCDPAMALRLAEQPLLSDFKHLVLCGSFEYDLNMLNRFQQLVHLEIGIDLVGKVHLKLPRLRVLAFHRENMNCALSIGCPELSTLSYYARYTDLLDVKQPETIKSLETNLVDPECLDQFESVECLVTNQFRAINQATLLSLPKLRELRYIRDIDGLVLLFHNEVGTIDRVKRTVGEFMDEAKKLRGNDFRFTFSGFQLTNVNVDLIDFGVHVDINDSEWVCNEYVYLKNYHLIEPGALSFVLRIDYTSLLRNAAGEFPSCFSQKFTGIVEVQVHGAVADADHLLWFLKSLKFLRVLGFTGDAKLSQEFYNRLPAAARSLVSLRLEGSPKELHLNFDFILEFPRMPNLVIQPPLSLKSFVSLIRSSAKLVNPSFQVLPKEYARLWIQRKKGSTVWKITDFRRELVFESENADEIINFVEEYSA